MEVRHKSTTILGVLSPPKFAECIYLGRYHLSWFYILHVVIVPVSLLLQTFCKKGS